MGVKCEHFIIIIISNVKNVKLCDNNWKNSDYLKKVWVHRIHEINL